MYIVIFILITTCLILLYKYCSIKKYFQVMSSIIDEIAEGNFNRRFHSLRLTRSTEDLNSKLNILMDKFENIIEEKQYLEESRKRMISDIPFPLSHTSTHTLSLSSLKPIPMTPPSFPW